MVGSHMGADRVDHFVVGFAPSHETALTTDDSGHCFLLIVCTPPLLTECWHDLGVDAINESPALRADHHRVGWRASRGPPARTTGPTTVRISGSPPPSARHPRRSGRGFMARSPPFRHRDRTQCPDLKTAQASWTWGHRRSVEPAAKAES